MGWLTNMAWDVIVRESRYLSPPSPFRPAEELRVCGGMSVSSPALSLYPCTLCSGWDRCRNPRFRDEDDKILEQAGTCGLYVIKKVTSLWSSSITLFKDYESCLKRSTDAHGVCYHIVI